MTSSRPRRRAGTAPSARAERIPSGPISSKEVTPSAVSVSTASEKRTVPRTWSAQYWADRRSSPVASFPVTVETTAIRGAAYVSSDATALNSASIGSINGEWNAWLTHQPGPGDHQTDRVLQREHPRHMRRRDLTDRMPGHEVRLHTPRLHQTEQRDLDREQRRLRPPRLVQALTRGDHLTDRTAKTRVQEAGRLVEGGGEDGEGGVELLCHAGALGALAGEEEAEPAARAFSAHQAGGRTALGERLHSREKFAPVAAGHHGAVVEGRTAGREGEADVERGHAEVGRQPGVEPPGLVAERVRRLAGHGPRHDRERRRCRTRTRGDLPRRLGRRRRGPLGGLRRGLLGRRLLDDHVRVGAAEAERGDGGAARGAGLRPRPGLVEEGDGARVPVDMGGRFVDVQGAGQHAVMFDLREPR